ncbi:hypothetical protein GCM10027451_36190 [Geodermatophilus aquaeductus]|uniref:Uncharacterized protein n=1 Tax=Geodermatophilus aquaeductus TaxID=1564161 RepID=A0A521FJB2_9ACTN|nr:hypothetical protein SAMN06273567_109180 [Geodermatophilus aquaeductus]
MTARRLSAVLLAAVVVVLTSATPAAAHTDRGVAGSDYDGRVLGTSVSMPGVTVRVTEFGDSLELLNGSASTVTVYGYSDEEYLRIGPDGVWRNANSPATYINIRRDGAVSLPARADARATPAWEQVSTQPEYSWHDHRTHWMSPNPPPQVTAAPEAEHTIFTWEVPLALDGAPVLVTGELTWSPPPRGAVWWPLYALIVLAGALAGFRARTLRPLAALLTLSTTAAVWHLVATPQSGLTALDRGLALGQASLPTLLIAAVTVLAVRAAWRGNGLLAGILAALIGFTHLVQGLPDMDVLWSANVITGGPTVLARLSVALLILGGLGLMAGAAGAVRRFPPQPEDAVAPGDRPSTVAG